MSAHERNCALTERVGRALYGDDWKAPLSRRLGVSRTTIHYWGTGERGWPPNIEEQLLSAAKAERADARERAREIGELIRDLENGK